MSLIGDEVSGAPDIRALASTNLDQLINRTLAFYRDLHRPFEWKTFAHDGDQITGKLTDAGLVPAETEALVLGDTADLTGPEGTITNVTIRPGSLADLPGASDNPHAERRLPSAIGAGARCDASTDQSPSPG